MKCPKCGYNSFEYHDSCTKCSHDLEGYKESHGLKAIVLPLAARAAMAESLKDESITAGPAVGETTATAAPDMFSFDLPEEEAAAPPAAAAVEQDPFSFITEPASEQPQSFGDFPSDAGEKSAQAKAEEEAFASLLESNTADAFGDVFGETPATPSTAASEPSGAAAESPGEFDLENFSWDDTPVATGGESPKSVEDDFDSLFGGTDETKK